MPANDYEDLSTSELHDIHGRNRTRFHQTYAATHGRWTDNKTKPIQALFNPIESLFADGSEWTEAPERYHQEKHEKATKKYQSSKAALEKRGERESERSDWQEIKDYSVGFKKGFTKGGVFSQLWKRFKGS